MTDYRPETYWSDRLGNGFDLRATGHLGYSAAYNDWLYRAKARALARALESSRPGAKALDIGSGVGWVVDQLRGRGLQTDGSDITDVAVERLRSRFPGSEFFKLALGADPIPRPDGVYDVITALDVSYHIVDDDLWLEGLGELARTLAPGGRLVVSDGFGSEDIESDCLVRFRSRATWEASERVGLCLQGDPQPYFRWLSRDPQARGFRHLGDRPRGAIEYALETLVPREPHMRWATLVRTTPQPSVA